MGIPAEECTRPVVYSVPNPDLPFNLGGTCFVIRFRGRLWAITAKHVLRNTQVHISQVQIPYDLSCSGFFPLADAATFEDYPTDSDCTDIVLFEIDEKRIAEGRYDPGTVYDLDGEPDYQVTGDMLLALHGFPDADNFANEVDQSLEIQRLSLCGKFGDESQATGCREIHLFDAGKIESHSGLSGCPVFIASSEFQQFTESKLIGVNLRGSAENLKKHYVDVFAVKALIDYHIQKTKGSGL